MGSSQIPPCPPYGGSAQQSLWPMIYQASINQGVDPNLAYSLMVSEGLYSNGAWQSNPDTGAAGPFQVIQSTANAYGLPGAADPNSPTFLQDNINAGVHDLAVKLDNNNGDVQAALFAYKGATSDAGKASVANSVSTVMERAGDAGVHANIPEDPTLIPVAGAYTPLTNNTANIDLTQLFAPIVIAEGLDATPWYQDPGLITGNPRLRNEVQPVSFKVLLHDNKNFLLSSKGETGTPIQVQLNASMKTMNWSMKHVYHHQRTRTAHHITMWGMQADLIEGTCTTGIFMNQFGLTDYYSTRTVNDKLKQLVANGSLFQAFSDSSNPSSLGGNASQIDQSLFNGTTTVFGPNGQSVTSASGSSGYQALINSAARSNPAFSQTNAFRVAAQDAFMEFLALFKMNGSVWFWNKLYNDSLGDTRDWVGIQAWSPTLGLNAAQKNARNNDVVTRGGVLMAYRNFVYQGYFKSLQWVMDAHNPFKWDFSFTFQVERTIGQQFTPVGN